MVAGYFLMQCEIRTITPDEARTLLKNNSVNRPLIASQLASLEAELKRGGMQLTHQGIAVSSTGKLLDGQHRLHAIANTGISARMLYSWDLPDSVFSVLDSGSKRSASDVLHTDGAINTTAMAAAIRLFIFWKRMPELVWVGKLPKTYATNTTILEEYHCDPDAWQWAASTVMRHQKNRVLAPGPMGCLLYLAATRGSFSGEYLETFCAELSSGANLPARHPILAYRAKVISTAALSSSQGRLADYIKLLNAYTTGQQLKIFKSQPFPPMPSLIHASESIHEIAEDANR